MSWCGIGVPFFQATHIHRSLLNNSDYGISHIKYFVMHTLWILSLVAQTAPVHPLALTSIPTSSELEADSIRKVITRAKKFKNVLHARLLNQSDYGRVIQSIPVNVFTSKHEPVTPTCRILPEIFLWCLDDDGIRSMKGTPIVLGQVCSY